MTKPFDLPAFKAFVEGKPSGQMYPGMDAHRCALAQFGCPDVSSLTPRGVPATVYDAATQLPHTFGALAERLNKLGEVEQ